MDFYPAPSFSEPEIPGHFRALSTAYLDGAERMVTDLAERTWQPDFYRGQVVLWLAQHATELFLKACIRRASPSFTKNVHSLGELLVEFEARFPGLDFELPFGPAPVPADWELMEMALEFDRTSHEQLRYPVGRGNTMWSENRSFQPDLFVASLGKLREEINRISLVVFTES